MCSPEKIVITVDIRKNRMRIYKSTLRLMDNPKHVQLLICVPKQTFIIRAVEKEDPQLQTVRILPNFLSPESPCEIYSQTFIKKLKEALGNIDSSKSYRLTGTYLPKQNLTVFPFSTLQEIKN